MAKEQTVYTHLVKLNQLRIEDKEHDIIIERMRSVRRLERN